jgi:elongation factor 1-alpha
VLNHPSAIHINYEPVVHAENVMQSARLVDIRVVSRKPSSPGAIPDDPSCLYMGDKALCTFRFLYQPEYMLSGAAIVIREGRTRGVGTVVQAVVVA